MVHVSVDWVCIFRVTSLKWLLSIISRSLMKNKTDLVIGIVILIFCAVMGYQISLIPENISDRLFNPYTLPTMVNYSLAFLASVLILKSLWVKKSDSIWPDAQVMRRVLLMSIFIGAYTLGFIYLGDYAYKSLWPMGSAFSIATFLFLCLAQVACGYRRVLQIVIISFLYTVICYVTFGLFFNVPLP